MSVLRKPVITEKNTAAGEKLGSYCFIVDPKANKIEIRKAVEQMYNVTVARVNTIRSGGKLKMRQTKNSVSYGVKGAGKKAIVTLKKGDTIDFYSSI